MERTNIHNLLSDEKTLNRFCNDIKNGAVAVIPTDTFKNVIGDKPVKLLTTIAKPPKPPYTMLLGIIKAL